MTTATQSKAEIMANRKSFDEINIQFWTDGSVTIGYFSTYVKGCGIAKSANEIGKNVEAAWLLAGDVCLYDRSELPKAVKVARRAVRQTSIEPLSYFRQTMNP